MVAKERDSLEQRLRETLSENDHYINEIQMLREKASDARDAANDRNELRRLSL